MGADDPTSEFALFAEQVHHTHLTWTLWRRLFWKREVEYASAPDLVTAGDEAYRVTGQTSELLFVYVRWHLLRGVILDLCRLVADGMQSCGNDNLTVQRVLTNPALLKHDAACVTAKRRGDRLLKLVREQLQELRHKTIAHFDLAVALKQAPLPDVDLEHVDLAVRGLIDFVHAARCAIENREFNTASPLSRADRSVEREWNNAADRLVAMLARGLDGNQRASTR